MRLHSSYFSIVIYTSTVLKERKINRENFTLLDVKKYGKRGNKR